MKDWRGRGAMVKGPYPGSHGLSLISLTVYVFAIVCCKSEAFPFTTFGVLHNRPCIKHRRNALSTIY